MTFNAAVAEKNKKKRVKLFLVIRIFHATSSSLSLFLRFCVCWFVLYFWILSWDLHSKSNGQQPGKLRTITSTFASFGGWRNNLSSRWWWWWTIFVSLRSLSHLFTKVDLLLRIEISVEILKRFSPYSGGGLLRNNPVLSGHRNRHFSSHSWS